LAIALAFPLVANSQTKTTQSTETTSGNTQNKTVTGGGHTFQQVFDYNGTIYENTLHESDFSDVPLWSVENGEPPLPISKVIGIASSNLKRFVSKDDKWKVTSVGFSEFVENKWVFSVSFKRSGEKKIVQVAPGEYRQLGDEFYIFVKTDGVIIEPKARPKENQQK